MISSFCWCVRRWPFTFEIWHMTNLLYLTPSWPLTWSNDFRPPINPTFQVWPKLNIFLIFTSKKLLDIFTVISSKLVPDLNFGSTQLTRYPYERWFSINLANFKQLFLQNSLTYETKTSTKLKILISSFCWCVRHWPFTFEIWHMTIVLYWTSCWPLTWSIDFQPKINPTLKVWPKLNIYFDFNKQNTFRHFHRNFIEIGARP